MELIEQPGENPTVLTPLPDWLLLELEKRVAEADVDPGAGILFEVAKSRWLTGETVPKRQDV